MEQVEQAVTTVNNIFTTYDLPLDALGATALALIYGQPLAAYNQEFGGYVGLSVLETNKLRITQKPSDATNTTVVRPNTDTVYALAVMDLTSQDLVLTIPPMQSDRFYLFSLYDPYGDNFASLGSVNASKPGEYLITPSLGSGAGGLMDSGDCPSYMGCVTSPTFEGTLLIRVELKRNATEDLDVISDFLNQVQLKSINSRTTSYAPLTPSQLELLSPDGNTRALQLTARLFARNPPETSAFRYVIEPILQAAGINIDTADYVQPANVDLTEAGTMYGKALLSWLGNSSDVAPLNNGWTVVAPSISGTFENGMDLVSRAAIATAGYLQNEPSQAVYPMAPERTYTLQEGEAYILTFVGGKPPILPIGFWSLTIYNAQGFLIANPQGTYALGDRSNLTYPDGSLIYPSGNNDKDSLPVDSRPFQLLVQSSDIQPPQNWTSNWLPSPADGSEFELTLRFFGPTSELVYDLAGAYQYPTFQKVSALRS
ncbi:MAG: hypothetical protein M1828_005257 [Chrysothrix sp. TS-e1954]|nr:MAG: hypothetical protein M1828_005257 [Chrysothrix sp. TS-e1954]